MINTNQSILSVIQDIATGLIEKRISNSEVSILQNVKNCMLTTKQSFLYKLIMTIYTLQLHFYKADELESLYAFIPKECLPSDFGGHLGTVAELHGNFYCFFFTAF